MSSTPDDSQNSWLSKMGDVLGINPSESSPPPSESGSAGTPEAEQASSEEEGGWFDSVKETVSEVVDEVTETVKDTVDGASSQTQSGGMPPQTDTTESADEEPGFFDKLTEGVREVVDKVTETAGGVADEVKNVVDEAVEKARETVSTFGDDEEADEAGTAGGETEEGTGGEEAVKLGAGPHTLQVNVKHEGADLDGATVSILLQGTSQSLTGTTNASGFVVFSGLPDGTYIVNAAKEALYVGTGSITLPVGIAQITIETKKKKEDDDDDEGEVGVAPLNVTVVWQEAGATRPVDTATVAISGPTRAEKNAPGGKASWTRVDSGDYVITASAVPPDGTVSLSGSASATVAAGQPKFVTVPIPLDDPATLSVRVFWVSSTGHKTPGSNVKVWVTPGVWAGEGPDATFSDLPPGTYDVTVEGNTSSGPVSDTAAIPLGPGEEYTKVFNLRVPDEKGPGVEVPPPSDCSREAVVAMLMKNPTFLQHDFKARQGSSRDLIMRNQMIDEAVAMCESGKLYVPPLKK